MHPNMIALLSRSCEEFPELRFESVGFLGRELCLRREVALKILPAEVSADASRRARFEQEAHAAAALNHPNILSVYDVGRSDDVSYIASELVSGETLAATLSLPDTVFISPNAPQPKS